jgi:NAD(P)-dependent dehydrogenase (short-subunit alcohol dehydrogenase family)
MLAATSAVAPIIIKGGRDGSIINVASIEGSRAELQAESRETVALHARHRPSTLLLHELRSSPRYVC